MYVYLIYCWLALLLLMPGLFYFFGCTCLNFADIRFFTWHNWVKVFMKSGWQLKVFHLAPSPKKYARSLSWINYGLFNVIKCLHFFGLATECIWSLAASQKMIGIKFKDKYESLRISWMSYHTLIIFSWSIMFVLQVGWSSNGACWSVFAHF